MSLKCSDKKLLLRNSFVFLKNHVLVIRVSGTFLYGDRLFGADSFLSFFFFLVFSVVFLFDLSAGLVSAKFFIFQKGFCWRFYFSLCQEVFSM